MKNIKKKTESQKEEVSLKFKHRLKLYYIYTWHVSRLYLTLAPLIDHMDDIEVASRTSRNDECCRYHAYIPADKA